MFTVMRGNNGRVIYIGRVAAKNDHGFRLTGMEWNRDTKTEEERSIECQFDPDVMEQAKKIKVNNYLLVMMMPSRKDPNKGVAEVLGFLGDVMTIVNERGNEKRIVMSTLRVVKKTKNTNVSSLSMTGLRNEGQQIGKPSDYTGKDGKQHTSYWCNFLACNSTMYDRHLADQVVAALKPKDIVLLVYHDVSRDGEDEDTHFIDNFRILYRPKSADKQETAEKQEKGTEAAPENKTAEPAQDSRTPGTQGGGQPAPSAAESTEAPAQMKNDFTMLSEEELAELPFS